MVVDLEEGEVACIYRYDALGNCTVLKADGTLDTNRQSIGNSNPFRWKSFYYDVESGFYYANGSYYDPSTGMYLDSAPVSAVIDNAFNLCSLDRNAPVCDNILELSGNPFTVATASNLSPDLSYDPYANAPWYIIARNWIQDVIYQAHKWYKSIPPYVKQIVGVALLSLAVLLATVKDGPLGAISVIAFVVFGTLAEVGMSMAVSAFKGTTLTREELSNVALDAFLVNSAIAFISTGINALKFLTRKARIKHALKVRAKTYRKSINADVTIDKKNLQFATVAYDSQLGTYSYAYNSEMELSEKTLNSALQGMGAKTSCAEIQAVNKALNAGSQLGDLYIYTVHTVNGKPAYACRVCTRVLNGDVAAIFTGLYPY